MPAVIGKIVPGRTDREGGSAAGSPLRQGRLVRPGAPANPRRAAPVIASRVRFLESNVGGTTEAMLSSQCGTEAYFFVLHLPLGRGGKDERRTPQSGFAGQLRLAVPEKRCGLTLFLAFFDRCGNSVFASERLAAFAVPGPVSRRPANGAAAEIPVTLHLPPAARNRNPATGSAKPQFPLGRGAQKEREPLRPSVSTGAPPLRQGRQR